MNFEKEKLHESNDWLFITLKSIGDAVIATDSAGLIAFMNPVSEALTGWRQNEALGQPLKKVFNIISEQTGKAAINPVDKVMRDGVIVGLANHTLLINRMGGKIPIEDSAAPIKDETGSIIGAVLVFHDISERRRAEHALLESETRFRKLAEYSPFGLSIMNPDRTFEYLNPKFTEIFGYDIHDIPTKDIWFNKAYPDERYREMVMSNWNQDFVKKVTIEEIIPRVFTVRCKDGKDKIIQFRGVCYEDGRFHLTYEDITAQTIAAQQLKRSEERYRTLFESSIDAIYITTREGILLDANPSFLNLFGYNREDLVGENILKTYANPADRIEFRRGISEKGAVKEHEVKLRKKDGSKMDCRVNAALWKDEDGAVIGYQGIIRDITEHRKLEYHLQQAQKMEAIGTLAGGIAHDFNNLLMGIRGSTSLIQLDLEQGHLSEKYLQNIDQYVDRGAELTQQLLGFARGGKYNVIAADLNELIKKNSELFGRTRKEICIHTKFHEGGCPVEIDQGQIDQVFLNIYVNAWQAMPDGGDLFIQTEITYLDEDYTKQFKARAGNYVKVSVTDTGTGMDEETKRRIFDPFFSTKEKGKGTGLGLASAYGIIRNHGGIITAYSEKGIGSTFNIYLPTTEKAITEKKHVPNQVLRGTETVLLVDDEEMIIDVGKEILETLGYRVLCAKGGKIAVDLYKERISRIDIVILDMIMPEMGGAETFEKLKNINPDVKILLSSGYSMNGHASNMLTRGCDGFIQKPFTVIKLSQALRDILGRK